MIQFTFEWKPQGFKYTTTDAGWSFRMPFVTIRRYYFHGLDHFDAWLTEYMHYETMLKQGKVVLMPDINPTDKIFVVKEMPGSAGMPKLH